MKRRWVEGVYNVGGDIGRVVRENKLITGALVGMVLGCVGVTHPNYFYSMPKKPAVVSRAEELNREIYGPKYGNIDFLRAEGIDSIREATRRDMKELEVLTGSTEFRREEMQYQAACRTSKTVQMSSCLLAIGSVFALTGLTIFRKDRTRR